MKTFFLGFVVVALLTSCNKKENSTKDSSSSNDTPCGDHQSNQLYKESSGNCYYIDANGKKQYVEQHECNC
jgi:hypothetical protein